MADDVLSERALNTIDVLQSDPAVMTRRSARRAADLIADLTHDRDRLRAREARLAEALRECAEDLEQAIRERYAGTLHYPTQSFKMKQDLEPVRKARAALEDKNDG